ncbi:MFS transporter [Geobacter sp. SVR]|uniref:MFS transporter n=1 Tax=Geobacter sp. SVR TaxID=2495594 RepID=UPI00143EFB90|nr:MFS transporter [Geobacter sp. SVR]BCS53090.1 MFS transporter [Geobacter sp. SVR]GCF84475.1 MFS transporter [Geobacter sp. SVR]
MFGGIGVNVFILGLVSFLTDVSSEMIYPLLPLFVTSVLGGGPAFLGMIEGIAESTAALLKLSSGILSDRTGGRKGLVLAGYSLAAIARPLVALAASPAHVLLVRFFDRAGKGIRTSPRDALIADSTDQNMWGKAFGFQRALDHAGAILGPLVASGLLAWLAVDLRTVFWLAAIPGAMAVGLIVVKLRDVPRRTSVSSSTFDISPPRNIRGYLLVLLLFTLGNSSDAFLLLRAGQLGVSPARIPLLWTFFHAVKMLASMPFGALSDRIGRRSVIVAGWCVYALAYAGFALAGNELQIWLLFAWYGLFYGMTEGVEKAYLSDLAEPAERGAAFGWYNAAIGIGAFPASLLFGLIWQKVSPQAAFMSGAGLAGLASLLLIMLQPAPPGTSR